MSGGYSIFQTETNLKRVRNFGEQVSPRVPPVPIDGFEFSVFSIEIAESVGERVHHFP